MVARIFHRFRDFYSPKMRGGLCNARMKLWITMQGDAEFKCEEEHREWRHGPDMRALYSYRTGNHIPYTTRSFRSRIKSSNALPQTEPRIPPHSCNIPFRLRSTSHVIYRVLNWKGRIYCAFLVHLHVLKLRLEQDSKNMPVVEAGE